MKQQRHAEHSSSPQASRSQAQTLDSDTRAILEPKFGHNFGDVRVFADGQADQLAQRYDARALTVGQDVYFARDQYDPSSVAGLGLLAHELTHTIQQCKAAPVSDFASLRRDLAGEREAHVASSAVMNGHSATVTGSSPISVQCFEWGDALKPLGSWFGGMASDTQAQTKPDGSNPAAAAGVEMAKKGSGAMGFAQTAADFLTKQLVPNADGTGLESRSNPIVGGIGKALKVADAGLDVAASKADGQGWGEALAGGAGKLASGLLSGGGTYAQGSSGASADTWVNGISKVAGLANEGAKALGFSKSVTDTTQGVADGTSLAADVTPSTMQENMLKQGFRGLWNVGSGISNSWDQLKSGDYEGALLKGGSQVDKQVKDMKAGKAGAPLQGYAMATDIAADVASGKDFESTMLKTGSQGATTTAAGRAGTWLGDQAYQIINKDAPEAFDFAKKDIKKLLNWF